MVISGKAEDLTAIIIPCTAVAPEEIVCGIKKPKIRTISIGLWTLCSRSCCCKSMANHILMSVGSDLGFPLASNCTLLTLAFPENTCSERGLRLWQHWVNCGRSQHRIFQNQWTGVLVSAQFFRQREKNIFTVSTWGEEGWENLLGQLVCWLCHRSLLPSYLCIQYFMFNCNIRQIHADLQHPKNVSSLEMKMPLRFPMVISPINNLLFNRPCFYMNFVFTVSNH